jgi:inositol oxygenase
MKPYLPAAALAIIRYHSFYPWHREGAYAHFMNDTDRRMLPWVQAFNPYDLYSKSDSKPDLKALKPYYDELIAEFVPGRIAW